MNNDKIYQFKIHLLKIIEINLNEKMIYFLGSGFSMNFSISTWKDFVINLIENLIDYYKKERKNSLDIKNLKSLAKECNYNNLNFILQKIYNISQINTSESYEINKIIKNTYFEKFYLKESNEINNDNLLFFQKNLNKIITTNYDNLFFLNYSLEEIFSNEFQEKRWVSKDPRELIKEKSFYVPIHGTIMNDSFDENKNEKIWKNKEKDINLIKFGIIDSFESYEKAYSIECIKNNFNIKNYFENFISASYDNEFSLLFFGYSFNDLSIANSLIKFLSKTEIKKNNLRDYNFIYIMIYDLENYIISKIFEDIEINQATNIVKNDKIVFLNLSLFFELWMSDERYIRFKKEFKNKIDLLHNKVKELEKLLSNQFESLWNLENKTNIIKQIPEFSDIKKFLDQKVIESVRDIFKTFFEKKQKIKQELEIIDVESPIFDSYKFVIKNLELLKEGIDGSNLDPFPFLIKESNSEKLFLLYDIIFTKKYKNREVKDSDLIKINENNVFIYAYSLIDQLNLNYYLSNPKLDVSTKQLIEDIYKLFFDNFKLNSLKYYDQKNDKWKIEKLPNFFEKVISNQLFEKEVNNIKELFKKDYSNEQWKEWSGF